MEQTLLIIKPDSVEKKCTGKIIDFMENKGFVIKAMRMDRLSREKAAQFYAEHEGKHFFDALLDFMTSGPCVPVVLERDDAIKYLREVIGATNPAEAAEGTIRSLYGDGGTRNAVHGSDSPDSSERERSFFFPDM